MEGRSCDSDNFTWIKPPASGNNAVFSFFLPNSLCYDAYKMLLLGFLRWGGDVLWHLVELADIWTRSQRSLPTVTTLWLNDLLFASILILLLQLLTHPQPQLSAFCPAICMLHPTGTRQLQELHLPARWTGFHTNQKQTTTDLSQLITFFTPMKQNQSQSLRKPIPHENRKPKRKYPAETRYNHPWLSIQGRKCDMKTTDICYIVHCTMCWEEMKVCLKREEQNSSTNSQEEASIETHPHQKLALRSDRQ